MLSFMNTFSQYHCPMIEGQLLQLLDALPML